VTLRFRRGFNKVRAGTALARHAATNARQADDLSGWQARPGLL
jgi:hypothetical protein